MRFDSKRVGESSTYRVFESFILSGSSNRRVFCDTSVSIGKPKPWLRSSTMVNQVGVSMVEEVLMGTDSFRGSGIFGEHSEGSVNTGSCWGLKETSLWFWWLKDQSVLFKVFYTDFLGVLLTSWFNRAWESENVCHFKFLCVRRIRLAQF